MITKSLSVGSSFAIAAASAVAPIVATPASAVGTAPVCAPGETQNFSDGFDNWYQTFVPQFGVGKVEFTISSETDFPADFKDLTDPAVSVTTTTDLDALNEYFDYTYAIPFLGLARTDDGSNPRLQRYEAQSLLDEEAAFFAISSVSEVVPANAPDSCDAFGSYARVFSVTFEPLDVTFTQTVNGEDWTYHVVMTPQTQYVAGTFDGSGFDDTQPFCVAQGAFVAGAAAGSGPFDDWYAAVFEAQYVNPYSSNDGHFVADYPRHVPSDLPATGTNVVTLLGVGAMTLAVGGLLLTLRRRRAD